MTVLLVDFELGSYRLVIKDDKKEKLYVWMYVDNVFHKKLSKKLVNKLVMSSISNNFPYLADRNLSGVILWKYET